MARSTTCDVWGSGYSAACVREWAGIGLRYGTRGLGWGCSACEARSHTTRMSSYAARRRPRSPHSVGGRPPSYGHGGHMSVTGDPTAALRMNNASPAVIAPELLTSHTHSAQL